MAGSGIQTVCRHMSYSAANRQRGTTRPSMSGEAVAVLWGAAVIVAWSGVCWSLGALWEWHRENK